MNKVILIGRFTRDLEVKEAGSGVKLLNNTLAVKRKMKTDVTDFINITAFGKTAENLEKFFKKGDNVAIVGNLQVSDNGKTGDDKRVYSNVVIDEFTFTGGKKKDDEVPF